MGIKNRETTVSPRLRGIGLGAAVLAGLLFVACSPDSSSDARATAQDQASSSFDQEVIDAIRQVEASRQPVVLPSDIECPDPGKHSSVKPVADNIRSNVISHEVNAAVNPDVRINEVYCAQAVQGQDGSTYTVIFSAEL